MTTINQLDGKRVIIPILLQIADFCMQPAKVIHNWEWSTQLSKSQTNHVLVGNETVKARIRLNKS